MNDWTQLPDDLPVPEDDGGARHLPGLELPITRLPGTHGRTVDLSSLSGRVVVFCYPRTGEPNVPNPDGWDAIPGARGCTPQSCAFRDAHADLLAHGVSHVFGLSTQPTAYQREVAERLDLPYPLLSDHTLDFASTINLPTFRVDGMVLLKRLTLIIEDGAIGHVFYPVFPPHTNAADVLGFIRRYPR
ncbi:peroxiredoxin [Aquabacter spiritensis]|uniref:Peroxiredoxin n=1 Tax=Aquabacter spiritensis TaxID=933073 RepID=A0A4R3LXW1_9HYPH|nr:peroxiredoxin [Aquabacter spiritensis]TCT03497.1 peroxiredoxin [Aquabacter spiritensis]